MLVTRLMVYNNLLMSEQMIVSFSSALAITSTFILKRKIGYCLPLQYPLCYVVLLIWIYTYSDCDLKSMYDIKVIKLSMYIL